MDSRPYIQSSKVNDVINTVADKRKPGNKWIVTFADMMMLLLCFFVLLFSFSNTDLQRFKLIAESMKSALGVSAGPRDLSVSSGSDIIALESGDSLLGSRRYDPTSQSTTTNSQDDALNNVNQTLVAQMMSALSVRFDKAIESGQINIQVGDEYVRITMKESTSFASGSGFIQPQQSQLISQIGAFLEDYPGRIEVIGHTDNLPIENDLYANNVMLSISRATAVADILNRQLTSRVVTISGKGSTEPLGSNNSVDGRKANRRVEIVISQGNPNHERLPEVVAPNHLNHKPD